MAVITCLNGEGEEEDREKAAAEVLEELQQQVCLSDLGSFPTLQKMGGGEGPVCAFFFRGPSRRRKCNLLFDVAGEIRRRCPEKNRMAISHLHACL